VRLVSYAMHWIKAEIHEYILKNWRMVKVATTKAQRKLFFNLRSLRRSAGTMTPEQIEGVARQLNVKPEEVSEMEIRMGGGDVALEGRSDDGSEEFAPIHYLADSSTEPMAVVERREFDALQGEGIEKALAGLDPRSRRIIQARWLNEDSDGSVGTATLHELASEFGVSAERIRQIEAKALRKMRETLSAYA
jgi:RNA polymerase sigma-32 factor